jgi:site-specific DNA-methyltransferase (adenine-specific)
MASQSVNCCVTSPPYFGLRDYGVEGQMGLEATPDEFVAALVTVLGEVRRVLSDDGTLWLNLGDSYARNPAKGQHKPGDSGKQAYLYDTGGGRASCTSQTGLADKQLIGIPWRVAFALQADGWYLRQDIIWQKPNVMPESVKDRCTKSHEYIFLLTKSPKYFFDHESIKEPGVDDAKRSRRSVWSVPTIPFKGAHFATFPPALIEPCILAGCPVNGVVLDPFGGSGTTAGVALANGRRAVLCELNAEYADIIPARISAIVSAAHRDLV